MSTFAPPISSQPAPSAAASGRGWPRARERSLLLTNLLALALAALTAWAPLRHSGSSSQALLVVARELAPLWAVFLLVHVALVVRRVRSDEYLLPLLSLIVLIGGVFHLGLDGPGGGAIRTYRADVLIGVVVVGAVVLLAAQLRRVGLLFEERVWWRVARDVPYYRSVPFLSQPMK